VREALGQERIDHLRDMAVADLKQGKHAQMFIDLINEMQPRLAEALPAERELNPDELANHVLSFHPRPSASG